MKDGLKTYTRFECMVNGIFQAIHFIVLLVVEILKVNRKLGMGDFFVDNSLKSSCKTSKDCDTFVSQ